MSSNESPETFQARRKIKEIFKRDHFEIEEEVELESVTNNMEEPIWPPYRADMLMLKIFIIELDPQGNKPGKSKGHGTKFRRIHDQWRDKNVKNQINIRTVRLIPSDILRQSQEQIIEEINDQLSKS